MKITIMHRVAATALMLIATGPGLAQESSPRNMSSQGTGPALVAELCTKCHGLDELVGLRQDREGWAETVNSMIARGAPIFPEEIDVIINYLSEVYPTGAR